MQDDSTINYIRFDLSTCAEIEEGEIVKQNLTGQRIDIGYNHTKRDGTIQKKERKSFITHDYCPWCGKEYGPNGNSGN